MTFWLFMALFYTPSVIEDAKDPLEGWLPSDIEMRNLDCEPLTATGARQRLPGQVTGPSARGDFFDRRAVICRERLMKPGVRKAADDALLAGLGDTAGELAGLVGDLEDHERDRTWLVETFHPDAGISAKIGFAVKNALLDRRLRVSDRAPALAADDIAIIGQLPPEKAYPLACVRYAATGSLGAGHALLAVVRRHPGETLLHGGLCVDGRWRWLR